MSLLDSRTLLGRTVTSTTIGAIVTLTQAEYDELPVKDANTLYVVVE